MRARQGRSQQKRRDNVDGSAHNHRYTRDPGVVRNNFGIGEDVHGVGVLVCCAPAPALPPMNAQFDTDSAADPAARVRGGARLVPDVAEPEVEEFAEAEAPFPTPIASARHWPFSLPTSSTAT